MIIATCNKCGEEYRHESEYCVSCGGQFVLRGPAASPWNYDMDAVDTSKCRPILVLTDDDSAYGICACEAAERLIEFKAWAAINLPEASNLPDGEGE